MIDTSPTCPVCGVAMRDPELHQKFHDGLGELVRVVYVPEMPPEDYQQLVQEEWDRTHQEAPGAA